MLKFGSVKSCGCSKSYKNIEQCFEKNTKKINECLEWTGTKTPDGYGRFKFRGKIHSAHRAHWELNMGKIPEGLLVCHHCNNRACVKIEHLFLAPRSQNSKDMVRKGRSAKGSRNGSAKLSEYKVMKILLTPAETSISDIAKKYGVHASTIRRVLDGKTWNHIKTDKNEKTKERNPRKINSRLRIKVLHRDKSTCKICGASPKKDPRITLHVDHIIPYSKGGKTLIENLQTLCSICNLGKSSETFGD